MARTRAPAGVGVTTALIVAGTIELLVLVVKTYEPRWVPPLNQMEEARSAAPRLTEDCETSGGAGGGVRTTTCWWSLRLDTKTKLDWPWPDPEGGVKQVGAYLRASAPITVWSWRGKVFQIATKDGHVYLAYDSAASWERQRQLWLAGVGAVVAACCTAVIALELWLRRSGASAGAGRVDSLIVKLYGVGGHGAVPILFAGKGRIWWAVLAMIPYSLGAGLLTGNLQPRLRKIRIQSGW